jgi:GDP-4-dehydro-6-deoxy-D-mannose reductase
MRVLITGASGFVGRHVQRELRGRGHDVLSDSAVLEKGADLADDAVADALVRDGQPNAIIHLAARVEARQDAWHDVLRSNQLSTLRLLDGVRRHAPAAHVVVASSSAVYGPVPRERNPVRESEPLRPATMYGASKVAVEGIAWAFAATGLRVTIVRPFNTIGPGGDRRSALAHWTRQLVGMETQAAGGVFRCGPLDTFRDLTDVRDVARAYAALLEAGAGSAVYNVCSSRAVEGKELLTMLFAAAGSQPMVESAPARPGDIEYQRGDHTALTGSTGWAPAIALEQTVRDVLREQRELISHESLTPHQ